MYCWSKYNLTAKFNTSAEVTEVENIFLAKVLGGGLCSSLGWNCTWHGKKSVLLTKSGPGVESRFRKKPLSGICNKPAFLDCLNVYWRPCTTLCVRFIFGFLHLLNNDSCILNWDIFKKNGIMWKNSQEDCGGYMGKLRRLYGLLVWNFSI